MLKHLKMVILGFIALSVVIVTAQEACSAIVDDALLAVDDFCGELGRNQACYGNFDLSAEAQPDVSEFVFEESGDVVDVDDILTLELSQLDEELGTWGVAVMSLQADIPNTLPGQNVTFILFGDVYIENASTDEQTPMQAFYLRTGIGAVACEDAPESGLLIQSPDGVDEVTFNVNGVDVQVGSTVLFETTDEEGELEMVMSPIEGSLAVQFDDENFPAVEGTSLRLPLNEELLPDGRPGLPEAYNENRVAPLPIAPLPRAINTAPPMPDADLNNMRERIQNGQPPCGVDGLPPCENILPVLREGGNMPPPERWGQGFEPGVNCIVRPDVTVESEDLPPVIGETQAIPFCPPTDRANRPPPTRAIANNELPLDGDADEDGVLNADDACPMRAGTAEFNGCPEQPVDTDGDGIVDALDYCPNRSGSADTRGCPDAPRDTDGDGFPDALDVCPNRAGTAEFRGCPIDPRTVIADNNADCANFSDTNTVCPSDRDGDGIPNDSDRCPARPGTVENNGCPARATNLPSPTLAPTPVPVSDADGDGFADDVDRCPNYAGSFDGCPPDSDGDGLYDLQDNCPNQSGPSSNSGCPPPDSDGDGVPDGQDRCPNQRGTASRNGCPEPPPPPPDSDGDGVPDGQDNCPNQSGSSSNGGCPIVIQPPGGGGGNPTPDPNGDPDGDGVINSQDNCPGQAGPASNGGCPQASN